MFSGGRERPHWEKMGFLIFSGGKKGSIENKWVKQGAPGGYMKNIAHILNIITHTKTRRYI